MNFEGLEIQNENKPMGRVQRAEEKNRVICLFVMFNPGVMVIKMSKKKKIGSLGKIFTCT